MAARILAVGGFLLGLSTSSQAAPGDSGCIQTVTLRELNESIRSTEHAFSQLDTDRFEVASTRMRSQLPCSREPLSPSLAAAYHRAEGLRLVMARDAEQAELAFAAARAADPGFRYPDDFVPPGSPVYENYFALGLATATAVPLAPPMTGALFVDGLPTEQRPETWPTIFQHVGPDGIAKTTRYLWPGDPLPPYPVQRDAPRMRRGALIAATSLLATAGGLFAGAFATRSVYDDPLTPYGDLDGLRNRIVVFTVASGILAGAGVGIGAWALAPKRYDAAGSGTGNRSLPSDSAYR